MKLKGIYTVIQNDKILAKSQNQITSDGFRLLQNWFSSTKQENIKRIDVSDETNSVTISQSDGLKSESMFDVSQLFNGYTGKYYYTTTKEDYIRVVFKQKKQETNQYQLQKRKIYAIGIDVIRMPMSGQTYNVALKKNANIQLRYTDNIQLQGMTLDNISDFTIPISVVQKSFNKNDVGYAQKIYYLSQPTDMSQIKIKFNTFNDEFFRYVIYAINLYEYQQILLPPTHMTLYGIGENQSEYSEATKKQLFHQQIQLSYPNSSNGYSSVFKTLLPYDKLNSTTQVFAISTDYYENGQKKMFSYSEYEAPWTQQQLTNIQLQYQLFFSNQVANSSSDNELNQQ